MKKLIPISLFATLMTAGAAIAQTPSPSTQPPSSTPPSPPSAAEKMSPPASTLAERQCRRADDEAER